MGILLNTENKPHPLIGNQHAKKENRLVGDMLRMIVTQEPAKLRNAVNAVLRKAAKGDVPAFNAIADRLDGKVGSTGGESIRILLLRSVTDVQAIDNVNVPALEHCLVEPTHGGD